jgi:hypothetical protein
VAALDRPVAALDRPVAALDRSVVALDRLLASGPCHDTSQARTFPYDENR